MFTNVCNRWSDRCFAGHFGCDVSYPAMLAWTERHQKHGPVRMHVNKVDLYPCEGRCRPDSRHLNGRSRHTNGLCLDVFDSGLLGRSRCVDAEEFVNRTDMWLVFMLSLNVQALRSGPAHPPSRLNSHAAILNRTPYVSSSLHDRANDVPRSGRVTAHRS